MKRPIAGLLASAAAVPGAWFLASGDEADTAVPLAAAPPGSETVQPQADPAQWLAAVEPGFGQAAADAAPAFFAPVIDLRATEEAVEPELVAAPPVPDPAVASPEIDLVAALPAPPEPAPPAIAKVPEASKLPVFIAEPVIQALPVLAIAAPEPASAVAVARSEAAKPVPAFRETPIRPVIAQESVAAAQLAPAPIVMAAALPVPAKAPPVAAPPAIAEAPRVPAPETRKLPVFIAEPMVQTLAVAAPKSAAAPAPVVAIAHSEAARPIPSVQEKPVAPVVAKQSVEAAKPAAIEPILAARPSAPPVPVDSLVRQPVTPVALAALPQPPKVVDVAAAPSSVRQTQPPAPPRPAIAEPVGKVVLASFAPVAAEPVPAPPVTAPPATARGAPIESTAARTVLVGAPASAQIPEPAFGPPAPRFIPAAISMAEPAAPTASIGSAGTLAQAIAYSYETNPRLLAERASTRAADLGYPAARAAFGPRVDASASLSFTRDRDETVPGSFLRRQGWSDTAGLILSQPLLTFGRSQARVGEAAANIEYRREALHLVQNEVMLDVIAAYVGTLREAGAVTIARENVALLQRQLDDSNARFAVREITLADVQQVETRLALGKTLLLEAQARLGEVQSRFYRAVGMPPGELAPPEPLTLPVTSLSDAYALADTQSPLVRAAQARERVSRAFLAATRAEAAPRMDFRGSADYGTLTEYSRELRATRLRGTVTLSVPLFDSGAQWAENGQAREANAADLQLVAAAQRDSRTAVATGWNNLLAARMAIDHHRMAVESAQRAWENAQRQERAGMRTTLDVLDLARDLLNVRNGYNAALASEYQARADLLATLGRLDPAGMTEGLKLYDPADHFRRVKGRGDIPLLTGALAALDGVALPDLKTPRPSTDAAQLLGTAETVTGE